MTIEVWRSVRDRQWYATIVSDNGRVIFTNTQGYTRKDKAMKMANRVANGGLRVKEYGDLQDPDKRKGHLRSA